MGKSYENMIKTTAGFTFDVKKPLDDRIVVESENDLKNLISYNGLLVFVIKHNRFYYKDKDGQWKPGPTLNDIWGESGKPPEGVNSFIEYLDNNYQKIPETEDAYLTEKQADDKYLSLEKAGSDYLTKTLIEQTFLSKANAEQNYAIIGTEQDQENQLTLYGVKAHAEFYTDSEIKKLSQQTGLVWQDFKEE